MFQNNVNLPREDYKHVFTQKELDEYKRCMIDPVYFAVKYMKIVNVDLGLIGFAMWDFQKEMLQSFHDNRFNICKLPRQVGKTTTSVAFLLHYILFNENVSVAILANKATTAREIMGRLQLAFEYLPMFLKQGVVEWNKGTVVLANGSKAMADSTSGSSVRGKTFNVIFLDEFAFVPNNIAEAFFSSTYPTISSGKTSKVIIVSTPNGLNLFYRMWMDAVEKRSDYKPIEIHWSMVPGRDEEWKKETIRNTSEEQFRQEFETEFIGSTNTLIHPAKIRSMVFKNPIIKDGYMDIYEQPIPNHVYTISVDVAEGVNLDYSTMAIIDVTSLPYRLVAKYRNNKISPYLFPAVILQAGRKYNDAYVLVEINSIGLQVADILHFELGYDNLLKFQLKGRQGQFVSAGHVKKVAMGVKTSLQTKQIGCANFKTMIESDKLIIHDAQTILELSTFSAEPGSKTFSAEEGNNDDLVMPLVNFGWLTGQRHFKDNVMNDIRKTLQQEQLNMQEDDYIPFGFIDNGLEEEKTVEAGDVWFEDRKNKFVFDDFNWDWRSRF